MAKEVPVDTTKVHSSRPSGCVVDGRESETGGVWCRQPSLFWVLGVPSSTQGRRHGRCFHVTRTACEPMPDPLLGQGVGLGGSRHTLRGIPAAVLALAAPLLHRSCFLGRAHPCSVLVSSSGANQKFPLRVSPSEAELGPRSPECRSVPPHRLYYTTRGHAYSAG